MRLTFFTKYLFMLMVVLFAYHLFFLIKYFPGEQLKIKELLIAFGVAIRFDLSTIAYVSLPILLLTYFPIPDSWKGYFRMVKFISLLWLIFITIYLFIDLLYYPFSLRHLSFEIFNTTGDLVPLIKIGFKEYKLEIALLLFFLVSLTFIFLTLNSDKKKYKQQKRNIFLVIGKNLISFAFICFILIVFARGGFQMKPIKLSNAFVLDNPFWGHLSLNGVYTTLKTIYDLKIKKSRAKFNNFKCNNKDVLSKIPTMIVSDGEKLYSKEYPLFRRYDYKNDDFQKMNIVIFVMESWSGKFSKSCDGVVDATPFFSELSKKGLMIKHFLANGQRSIEGISAIVTGIPPWNGNILSDNPLFSQMPINFLPNILKRRGYETFFIHGAKYGSMGFSSFARHAGFSNYIAKEDLIKIGAKDDGVWGIYDEDTFLAAHSIFEKQKKPFFALIFSLSSHTPYRLPSERFKRFDKGLEWSQFLNSLYYSDYALSKFFEKAMKANYFDKTLFIIVGDHTEGKSTQDSIFTRFNVPCLFFAPKIIKPAVIYKKASQIDIAPTILHILKSNDYHASLGSSILKSNLQKPTILSYGDLAVYVKNDYFLVSSPEKAIDLYKYNKNMEKKKVQKITKESTIKRLYEEFTCYGYFVDSIIKGNKLFPPFNKINNNNI